MKLEDALFYAYQTGYAEGIKVMQKALSNNNALPLKIPSIHENYFELLKTTIDLEDYAE